MILGAFLLLLIVFAPGLGVEVKGARRWIRLGISNFQAVEAVKVFLIIYLAGYFVRHQEDPAAQSARRDQAAGGGRRP